MQKVLGSIRNVRFTQSTLRQASIRITRLMNNQNKKAPKDLLLQKKGQSDDKNALAIVKSVSQLGCVSQDSDALVSQGRKFRWNPIQKVLERNSKRSIHQVNATSREYPGQERTIAGEKCQSSSPAKSLRSEI